MRVTASGAKKRDYWWTVLVTDPVALPLAGLLARRRWLSPDQVTILALLFGLAVGPIFAIGTRWALVLGGLLFYAAFVWDCVDGKLARALGTSSPRGEALDHLADAGRRASASLGLAAWMWQNDDPRDLWWVLVYAVLAYLFIEISGAERAGGGPASELRGRWAAALAKRRLLPTPGMPDVQAIVFILGPIAGLVHAGLAAGIALVFVAILLTVWRRLR